jgi:hypothetical protein
MFLCAAASPRNISLIPGAPETFKPTTPKLTKSRTVDSGSVNPNLDLKSPNRLFAALLGILRRTDDMTMEHAIITVCAGGGREREESGGRREREWGKG